MGRSTSLRISSIRSFCITSISVILAPLRGTISTRCSISRRFRASLTGVRPRFGLSLSSVSDHTVPGFNVRSGINLCD
jgi:hypothetical protein